MRMRQQSFCWVPFREQEHQNVKHESVQSEEEKNAHVEQQSHFAAEVEVEEEEELESAVETHPHDVGLHEWGDQSPPLCACSETFVDSIEFGKLLFE